MLTASDGLSVYVADERFEIERRRKRRSEGIKMSGDQHDFLHCFFLESCSR
jgi:hypothetical protein